MDKEMKSNRDKLFDTITDLPIGQILRIRLPNDYSIKPSLIENKIIPTEKVAIFMKTVNDNLLLELILISPPWIIVSIIIVYITIIAIPVAVLIGWL